METKIKSVVTHYRDFHADDVFAVAILKMVNPKIKVIRCEYADKKNIDSADIRVDIGGKYDPKTLDFDHHQPDGAGVRDNGIPYASCGLVWHHFGKELTEDDRVYREIDKKIMQTLDAIDNGMEISEVKIIRPYTISDYIMSLNPQWPDEDLKNFDEGFDYAVEFARHVLETEIEKIKRRLLGEEKLKEYINSDINDNYLVLDANLPWREYVIEHTKYKYVIKYDKITDSWQIYAVPIMIGSFDTRHNFPKKWSGLKGKELESETDIEGAVFCHRNLFFAVAKTRESAIKMVEKALQKK